VSWAIRAPSAELLDGILDLADEPVADVTPGQGRCGVGAARVVDLVRPKMVERRRVIPFGTVD
jgi:hypothetical protein